MIFKSIDGSEFELGILAYQFPTLLDSEYDSNWLRIQAKIRHSDDSFDVTGIANCMDTYAVRELAEWLSQLGMGKQVGLRLKRGMMEPNLDFELIKVSRKYIVLRIYFKFGGYTRNGGCTSRLTRDYKIPLMEFREAVETWITEIEDFPTRKE